MIKNCIGRPHVVRSSTVENNIITCKKALHSYVSKNVYKFIKGKSCDFIEDLVSETFIDIAEYTKNFDSSRNISPETFINLRLKGSIVDNYVKYLQLVKTPRNNSNHTDSNSLIDNSFYNSVNPIFFGENEDDDHIENNIDHSFKADFQEKIMSRLDSIKIKDELINFVKNNFKDNDQKIFHLRFIEEKSQIEIGKILNRTSAAISDRERKIREKILGYFSKKLDDLTI